MLLYLGHCGNSVIGGVVTLTIHGVSLPNAINYVENGSYNFTSLNSEWYFKNEYNMNK